MTQDKKAALARTTPAGTFTVSTTDLRVHTASEDASVFAHVAMPSGSAARVIDRATFDRALLAAAEKHVTRSGRR